VKLVQVLCESYEKVTMIKPLTSRPANSEKYILCRNFKGVSPENEKFMRDLVTMQWNDTPTPLTPSLTHDDHLTQPIAIDLNTLPESKHDIVRNLVMFNTLYISRQVMYIQKTIEYIQKFSNANQFENNCIKRIIDSHIEKVKKWCNHYHIPL
jgi:cap1 methyltransferase